MAVPPRILKFCKSRVSKGVKRVGTRGCYPGAGRGVVVGKGGGTGLEETRNLAPQLLREQEAGGAGTGV